MHPITTKISTEIDVLYGLCKLAEDYSAGQDQHLQNDKSEINLSNKNQDPIMQRIDSVSKTAMRLFKTLGETDNIPINDKMLIKEKQEMMDDILHQFKNDKNDYIKQLYHHVMKIREQHAIKGGSKSANPSRFAP